MRKGGPVISERQRALAVVEREAGVNYGVGESMPLQARFAGRHSCRKVVPGGTVRQGRIFRVSGTHDRRYVLASTAVVSWHFLVNPLVVEYDV